MMLSRSLAFACLFAAAVGGCTWPPRPSVPPAPGQTAQTATGEGLTTVDGVVGGAVGTAGGAVGSLGRSAGNLTRSLPTSRVGGGGGLLR